MIEAVDDLVGPEVRSKRDLAPRLDALNEALAEDSQTYLLNKDYFYFFGESVVYTGEIRSE